ncbi:uncharacterized protein PSFLO_01086 [Pseudozyma flocculosa]|nr:uncharacterized protein PSFLO_01086 [Pseudozyma flocculosa]
MSDRRTSMSGPRTTFSSTEHFNASPLPMSGRPGDTMAPSMSGVFPPGQWDRSGGFANPPPMDPSDYGRRPSSAADMGSRGYPTPGASSGYDTNGQAHAAGASAPARKGGKEGGSGAITIGGKKRYPCQHPGCDKTFSTSGHAARHNRIHTGQKPYRCTFPGCKARFSRQDNSLQHYRTHILHPKGRSSQSSQAREASGQYELDGMEVEGLDAEAEAKAELGRRALEDGTAIAVVHEVKDQHGRKKGETIERMVGMPRGRRDSLHSTALEDERSTSPSSVGSARIERQASLPGIAHVEPPHYDGPSDFWSSSAVRHHRLSLPHPHGGVVPPEPYSRPGQPMAMSVAPGLAPAWSGGSSVFDPRLEMSSPQLSQSTASASRRESIDPALRTLPGLPDGDLRLDAASLRSANLSMPQPYGRANGFSGASPRFEQDPADFHRRSLSMGTSHDRGGAMPAQLRSSGAPYPISAPGSNMPSARASQSPKSSPTSSSNSGPDSAAARSLSVLDKLASANTSSTSLPAALSSLTARSRLLTGAAGSAGPGYQHPYSSDRSTNLDASSCRDDPLSSIPSGNLTLPLLHSSRSPLTGTIKANDDRELSTIDADRMATQPHNSALRSGASQDKITLPPLNPPGSGGRRW